MKKIFLGIVILGLPFLLINCSGAGAQETEGKVNNKIVKVSTVNLKNTESPIPIITSGVLSAKREARLSFKIGGVISAVYVDEGQYVQAGQVLARLEQTEINAQVSQAQMSVDKSYRDLERAENLYADTVATLEQVQNAETGYEIAQERLKIARYNQNYSTITAPSSGVVLKRLAETGELAGPGIPIFLVAVSSNAQIIRVGLADKDVVKLKLGNKAKVFFDAYPGEVFEAVVSEIAESANPRTGTFEVELVVNSKGKALKNGFVAKVEIFPSTGETYYKIPLGALVSADKKTGYVFVPNRKTKTAEKVKVKIEYIGSDFFTVRKSDAPKLEEVILEGASYLSNGEAIQF